MDAAGILCVLGPWALLIGYVVAATVRTRAQIRRWRRVRAGGFEIQQPARPEKD